MGEVNSIVYRMAEAMFDRFQQCVAHNFNANGRRAWTPEPFAEADAQVRAFYLASAQAGLEMLREPTDQMIAAGTEGRKAVESILARPNTLATWQGMIDAALTQHERSQTEG